MTNTRKITRENLRFSDIKIIIDIARESKMQLELYQMGVTRDWSSMVDLMIKDARRHPQYEAGSEQDHREWLTGQENNKLPNSSSGSFMTALTDFDNCLTCFLEDLDVDQHVWDYALAEWEREMENK